MLEGLQVIGDRWLAMEVFLPEMMQSVQAMKAALEILRPKIAAARQAELKLGTVVIGTVQGDIHDLGKNMVATMLEVSGFEVHDISVDVPPMAFVDKAGQVGADIIAMSALMATSMPAFGDVINLLKDMGLRDRYKVMIGGGPVTQLYADEIGADGYGKDVEEAVRVARKLVGAGVSR